MRPAPRDRHGPIQSARTRVQNQQLAGVLPKTYQIFDSMLLKGLLKRVSGGTFMCKGLMRALLVVALDEGVEAPLLLQHVRRDRFGRFLLQDRMHPLVAPVLFRPGLALVVESASQVSK
jgi:hypothetical protein